MNTRLTVTPRKPTNYHIHDTRMISDMKDTYNRQLETKQLQMELARCQEDYLNLSVSNRAKKSERHYTPDKKDKRSDFYRSAVKNIIDEIRDVDARYYSTQKSPKRRHIENQENIELPSLIKRTPRCNRSKFVKFDDEKSGSVDVDTIKAQMINYNQTNQMKNSMNYNSNHKDILDSFNTNIDIVNQSSGYKSNTHGISEFNPGHKSAFNLHKDRVDNMRDKKFEEKKQRFETYVINELPREINTFVTGFFDNNINQFKRDLHKENMELSKYVDGLKDFSSNIEEGKKRTQGDLLALQNELGLMQKSELDRREGLYTALERTELSRPRNMEPHKSSKFVGMNNFVENDRYVNKYLNNINFNNTLYDKGKDNVYKSACKLEGNRKSGIDSESIPPLKSGHDASKRKEAKNLIEDLEYILDY